jgi:hypothetical protein
MFARNLPSGEAALALSAGVCHKRGVRRLRDFAGIVAMLSDREIDEMQAAIDARRQARAGRPDELPEARTPRHVPKAEESGSGPRREAAL